MEYLFKEDLWGIVINRIQEHTMNDRIISWVVWMDLYILLSPIFYDFTKYSGESVITEINHLFSRGKTYKAKMRIIFRDGIHNMNTKGPLRV